MKREELIRQKIMAEQAVEERDTEAIRRAMFDFLTDSKGYLPEEIDMDRKFDVSSGDRDETTSTDFLVSIGGRIILAVKCAPSAIESRERHILAFSRVVDIPFSLVTDGKEALFLDALTGKVLSEDINALPSRDEALKLVEGDIFKRFPIEKLEKEKRILIAFDGIGCPQN